MQVNNQDNNRIYSDKVLAGKRTYFFDIKETRNGEPYLIISEKRKEMQEGMQQYKKNRIFLYKEDLSKFAQVFNKTYKHLENLMPDHQGPSKANEVPASQSPADPQEA